MTDERYRTLLDVAGRHAAGVPFNESRATEGHGDDRVRPAAYESRYFRSGSQYTPDQAGVEMSPVLGREKHPWRSLSVAPDGNKTLARNWSCQVRSIILPRIGEPTTSSRGQRIERTTPPSARTAAPLVAEDSGLARNVTSAATSSTVAKRCNSDDGRMV